LEIRWFDPFGLSQPCDQQNLATLARDVRLTLGAGCQKDCKTANGSAELSENLKTPVATDNCVFNTKLRLKLIEADSQKRGKLTLKARKGTLKTQEKIQLIFFRRRRIPRPIYPVREMDLFFSTTKNKKNKGKIGVLALW